MLEGIFKHCPLYPIAVFEDFGMRDDTVKYLTGGTKGEQAEEFLAIRHRLPWGDAFIGTENLGVAGNSNRALRWFEQGGWDHLCLCNDDLEVLGDFVSFYQGAHKDLGVGFFCFNDFWKWPSHRWATCRSRGYRLRIFRQMTGIMMSTTREAWQKVGYFDTRFRQFGQEHCDWTNRHRFAHNIDLDGIGQPCIDVEPTDSLGQLGPPVLRHQEVETCLVGEERQRADRESLEALEVVARGYHTEPLHRPFRLRQLTHVGGFMGQGIATEQMGGYAVTTCS
jgi:hypothetical protein